QFLKQHSLLHPHDRGCRLALCLEKTEWSLVAIYRFKAELAAGKDEAETCPAVVDVGHRYGGGVLHDVRPRSSCQASSTARARSRSEAKQVWPPASANRAIKSSCASLGRPPGALSSSAKELPRCQSSRSLAPANAPMRFKLAASRISREPPLGTCSHSTSGLARRRK